MKIVVNRCFGGFGLSHEAVMLYANKKGMNLYAFVEENNKLISHKFKPYDPNTKSFVIHYSTQPLTNDGQYQENTYFLERDIPRDDPYLVQVVEELGAKVNGDFANLEIVEIPDHVQWEISEYDGMERVEEQHRSW